MKSAPKKTAKGSKLLEAVRKLKNPPRKNWFNLLTQQQQDELYGIREAYRAGEISANLNTIRKAVAEEIPGVAGREQFREWMNG